MPKLPYEITPEMMEVINAPKEGLKQARQYTLDNLQDLCKELVSLNRGDFRQSEWKYSQLARILKGVESTNPYSLAETMIKAAAVEFAAGPMPKDHGACEHCMVGRIVNGVCTHCIPNRPNSPQPFKF